MYTIEELITKAKVVHGDKYEYDSSTYTKVNDKMRIICPKHGDFYQSMHQHINKKQGCPKCAIEFRSKCKTYETSDFIKKAIEVHGNYYDYSKVEYVNSFTKVCVICPKHGEFMTRADGHINGRGCPICRNKTKKVRKFNKKMSSNDFLIKCREKFGYKYTYDLSEYKNLSSKIKIICPKHGEFYQVANSHLNSYTGCPKCSYICDVDRKTKDKIDFINDAIKVHGNKYDYSKINYVNSNTKITITCPKHGEFEQLPYNHLNGNGCPKCGIINNGESCDENELYDFIKKVYNGTIIRGDREILSGKELDIYIPDKNIAIEYNGLYWHSELKKQDINYHINKSNMCLEKGIQLIHIFEDEWVNKKEICKSRIKSLLGISENKVYARKCIVKNIVYKEYDEFVVNNHIQGSVKGFVYLGLYYNNDLVCVMSFCKPRNNLGNKNKSENSYELLRFCNKIGYNVIGGASKLLKYFITTYNPNYIISYCDKRWSNGNMYEKLGFKLSHISKPNYFYVINNKRMNRFNYRKDILISKYGCDKNDTEHSFCLKQGWYRIYDCGTNVYHLKIK